MGLEIRLKGGLALIGLLGAAFEREKTIYYRQCNDKVLIRFNPKASEAAGRMILPSRK